MNDTRCADGSSLRKVRLRGLDEKLMQQRHIRRTQEPPSFVREEREQRNVYPHGQQLKHRDASATLKYRRSRWSWVGDEKAGVRRREVFCWVQVNRRRVAALQLFEFDASPWLSNEEFWLIMDTETSLESQLADVLCGAWRRFCDDVSMFGSLLDFRMAWAVPTNCFPGLLTAAARHLISREFPNHCLLTMKAFPLEYEGNAPAEAPSHSGLVFRQRAMVRYYEKEFGVRPFPGQSGADGWLYRVDPRFEARIKPPRPVIAIPT